MKVLTIKQPWATLIMQGDKRFEFRSWQTKYRGELLIHAGKGIDKEAVKRLANYFPKEYSVQPDVLYYYDFQNDVVHVHELYPKHAFLHELSRL